LKEDEHIPYEALGRYLSGKIDRDERASVERHLKDCVFCTQDLADAQTWLNQNPEPKKPWWKSLWLVAILCALATDAQSQSQRTYDAQHPPRFEEFPVTEKWQPPAAPVQLRTKAESMFKTRLRAASKEKPNFAGHFRFTIWGCGSNCYEGAIVNLKSGEVIPPPRSKAEFPWLMCGSAFEDSNVEVRSDSRLFIFKCGIWTEYLYKQIPDAYYYVWEENRFRQLLFVPGKPL
jgi:hypothetical protein